MSGAMGGDEDILGMPPPDPNRNQNRVPMEPQLSALLRIHNGNRLTAFQVGKRLTEAEAIYAQTQETYERQAQDLESTKFTLDKYRRSVDFLKQQKEAVNAEIMDLVGLLQPIRRCPEEILRYIFEWTHFFTDIRSIQTGLTLSHVCRSWRTIAHHTSSLWGGFMMRMDAKLPTEKAQTNFLLSRLLSRPAKWIGLVNLEADDDRRTQALWSFVADCQLDKFKSIECLVLHVRNGKDIRILLQPILGYSTGRLGTLELTAESVRSDDPVLKYDSVLQHFPTVEAVIVQGIASIRLRENRTFHNIRHLTLTDTKVSNSCQELHSFPNLQNLRLAKVNWVAPTLIDIFLPKLQQLDIENCPGFPWSRINSPLLETLYVTPGLSADAVDFLHHHDTVKSLVVDIKEGSFNPLRSPLEQLRVLQLESNFMEIFACSLIETNEQPFPQLTRLHLVIPDNDEFSPENLKVVLAARVTTNDAGITSGWIGGSVEVVVADYADNLDNASWRDAPEIAGCTQTYARAETYDNANVWAVVLRWN